VIPRCSNDRNAVRIGIKAPSKGEDEVRLKSKAAKAGVIAALSATGLFLSTTNAFADTQAATFTASQPDWGPGTTVYSNSIHLTFQDDGNLVIYSNSTGQALWASGTWGTGVDRLDWSAGDQAIDLYVGNNAWPLCKIAGYSGSYRAMVQDDGNFVFYDRNGNATWATSWGWGSQYNYCGISGH
jgi:hypothetical protein